LIFKAPYGGNSMPPSQKVDFYLREYFFGKNKMKMIGLKAKHKRGKNEDYFYKVGTWRTFYKNGNLKSLINYDIRVNKNGISQSFNQDGNRTEEKYFIHGEELK